MPLNAVIPVFYHVNYRRKQLHVKSSHQQAYRQEVEWVQVYYPGDPRANTRPETPTHGVANFDQSVM